MTIRRFGKRSRVEWHVGGDGGTVSNAEISESEIKRICGQDVSRNCERACEPVMHIVLPF